METNLEARFKRSRSKCRGGCQRRGILPPRGLAQNTEIEKDLTNWWWSLLFKLSLWHLSSIGPIRAIARLSASLSERWQFRMFCKRDRRRSWKVWLRVWDLDVLNLQEERFHISWPGMLSPFCRCDTMQVVHPVNIFWDAGKYVYKQCMKKVYKPGSYAGSKLCASGWPV